MLSHHVQTSDCWMGRQTYYCCYYMQLRQQLTLYFPSFVNTWISLAINRQFCLSAKRDRALCDEIRPNLKRKARIWDPFYIRFFKGDAKASFETLYNFFLLLNREKKMWIPKWHFCWAKEQTKRRFYCKFLMFRYSLFNKIQEKGLQLR